MNDKDQIETLKLAVRLISKAMSEDAYSGIVLPNAPQACINRLDLLIKELQNKKQAYD